MIGHCLDWSYRLPYRCDGPTRPSGKLLPAAATPGFLPFRALANKKPAISHFRRRSQRIKSPNFHRPGPRSRTPRISRVLLASLADHTVLAWACAGVTCTRFSDRPV
ncbi:hypothetical protein NKR23_g11644 [Pleurostoma richardsiae]|uniref:Uncharacterized protein n=1 Tax=Pleurostoma richardsiae TaxID=41990 RepID=A0AA38R2S9_9PEZI|nr:hypothetical protein NKR23_g11644 [Pleurostoma richardsiae]